MIVLATMVAVGGPELRLMTFNIRTDEGLPEELAWAARADSVCQVILAYEPDVVGIQEGLKHQVDYLIAHLPNYVMVGEGLQGGTKREHNAIFYRRDRFYLREAGSFWLRPIPDVVTWVRLAFIDDGREFVVMNTHLHQYQRPDDLTGWYMLLTKARSFVENYHVPVFLMGDMNEQKGLGVGWRILNTGEGLVFRDSWLFALERVGPVVSFGFRVKDQEEEEEKISDPYDPSLWYKQIDWILFMGDVNPLCIVTDTTKLNESYYVSDHRPVFVRFSFEPTVRVPTELAPPAFVYEGFEVSSTEIQAGEKVIVKVKIKNKGGLGSGEVSLFVDGEVMEKREIFLLPGAEVELEFSVELWTPGEHLIAVGDLPPKTIVVRPPSSPF